MSLSLRATNDGGGIILLNGSPKVTLDAAGNVIGSLTADRGDISKKLATTEFVRQNANNCFKIEPLTQDRILTINDVGGLFAITTPLIIARLPSVSSLFDGATFTIKNTVADGYATVVATGTDQIIICAGSAPTSVNLDRGETGVFVKFGSSWVLMGDTVNRRIPNFASLNLSNGYQKMPGGVIFQWGSVVLTNSGTPYTANYPIPFPNAVLSLSALPTSAISNVYWSVDSGNTARITLTQAFTGGTTYRWFVVGY